jgi:hypothetical protein
MQILPLNARTACTLLLPLASVFIVPAAPQAQTTKPAPPQAGVAAQPTPNSPWLFAGFKGDSIDGVYYAISLDGYHWKLANSGKAVVPPTEPGELMRDPFLQRAPDGTFRMVWTWAWYNLSVGYSSSRDLLTWTPHRQLPVMANEPTAANVWAPALYYEHAEKRWLIFWSSTIPGRSPGDDSGDSATTPEGRVGLNHRIYFTTTTDFKTFTPAKIFFDPGYSVIDATLLQPTGHGKPFTLIFKDERKIPLEKHLLTATGPSFEGPWSNISGPISETWSEGAAIIPVRATSDSPAGYLAYYDHYAQGQHYGAVFSPDLVHWSDALSRIEFPPGMRHGSFLQITQAEYDRLAAFTPAATSPAATPQAGPR